MQPNPPVEGMARPNLANAATPTAAAGNPPQPTAETAGPAAQPPANPVAEAAQPAQTPATPAALPGDAAQASPDLPHTGLPKLAQAFRQILQEEKRGLPAHIVDLLETMPEASQLEYLLRHRQPLGILGFAANPPAAVPASPQAAPVPPANPPAPTGRRLYENF